MLQVRNLPDEVHARLKERAVAEGMTLSDYVKRELTQLAQYRSNAEILAAARERAKARGLTIDAEDTVAALHEERRLRDEHMDWVFAQRGSEK